MFNTILNNKIQLYAVAIFVYKAKNVYAKSIISGTTFL